MKSKTVFVCTECGAKSAKWLGKCYSCGAWDSFVEQKSDKDKSRKTSASFEAEKIVKLKDVRADSTYRVKTGIIEFDRVLGGGVVPGSLILIGGDPGIGKSTLMLQMCSGLGKFNPLYISGEESLEQIKYRSQRLSGISGEMNIMTETNVESIVNAINIAESDIVIVDSIQSVYSDRIESTPGSVAQVRECTALLMQTAKDTGKAVFIIGHVTKEGIIAGPKILEHMVDTVLQFEGEKTYSYRILRAQKNRFGSTNEIGIFEMTEEGLRQVENPSELFLANRKQQDPGVAIAAAIEGTRPILLEAQSLVTPSGYAVPQRTSNGFDPRRLNMILAVLEKRLGEKFRQNDVFVNIAGGVYLNDPAVDLAISASLVSSLRDFPLSSKTVLIGEIGLTGEVRPVSAIDRRIREAIKLGFERIILPKSARNKVKTDDSIEVNEVERISVALSLLFG